MRTDILERKAEILQWIEENQSKAFICQQLRCKPETLNSYLKKMNIEYAGNKGSKGKPSRHYKSASEYIKGSNVKSHLLKEKLFREGIKKEECELCGANIWLGIKLPLELHHKDGNHFNNEFENLQILCPNCHSIQEGNSGANIGKYTKKNDDFKLKTKKEVKYCLDCGKEISEKAIRCKSCAAKEKNKINRVVENRPNRQELKNLVRNYSFLSIGKKYGVSDNAIRKWCKIEKIPYKKTEINSYSQEEWDLL